MKTRKRRGRSDGVPFIFMSRSTDRPMRKASRIRETLTAMCRVARFIGRRRTAAVGDIEKIFTDGREICLARVLDFLKRNLRDG